MTSDMRGIFIRFFLRASCTGRVPLFLPTIEVHSGPDTWSAMHTMPGFTGVPTNHSFYLGPMLGEVPKYFEPLSVCLHLSPACLVILNHFDLVGFCAQRICLTHTVHLM